MSAKCEYGQQQQYQLADDGCTVEWLNENGDDCDDDCAQYRCDNRYDTLQRTEAY